MSDKITFKDGISPSIPYKQIKCSDIPFQTYECAYRIYLPWKCKFPWEDDSKKEEKLVAVDKCLLSEILELWEMGIKTTGCCCGHGDISKAFIGVHPLHVKTMKEMGYKVYYNSCNPDSEDCFIPKTHFNYQDFPDVISLASEV